jgi:hypothetical protein
VVVVYTLDKMLKSMIDLSIFHTGMVQREYKTKLQGEQREEKKISKDELMKVGTIYC